MNKHAGHSQLLTLTTTSSHMNIHQTAYMQITLLRLQISTPLCEQCVCAFLQIKRLDCALKVYVTVLDIVSKHQESFFKEFLFHL